MTPEIDFLKEAMKKTLISWDLIALNVSAEYSRDQLDFHISSFIKDSSVVIHKLEKYKYIELCSNGKWRLTSTGLSFRKKYGGTSNIPKEIKASSEHNWKNFRSLLSYYIECASISGKKQYYMKNEKEGRLYYVPKSMKYGWLQSLDQEPKHHVMRFNRDEIRFKGSLLSDDSLNPEICLGYPVSASYTADKELEYFVPLTMIPVKRIKKKTQAKAYRENSVEVVFDFGQADINLEWIERCVPYEYHGELMNVLDNLRDEGTLDIAEAIPYILSYTNIKDACCDPDNLQQFIPEFSSKKKQLLNTAVLFKRVESPYIKTLIKELKMLKKTPASLFDQTALAYIYRDPPLKNSPEGREISIPFGLSNTEQDLAVSTALSSPVVQVQGPPGTGKSQLAVNLIANCIYRNHSVLFTSRNHAALDAIRDKSQKILGEDRALVQFCFEEDTRNRTAWYQNDYIEYASEFRGNERTNNKRKIDNFLKRIGVILDKYEKDAEVRDEFFEYERDFQQKMSDYLDRLALIGVDSEQFDISQLKELSKALKRAGQRSILSFFCKNRITRKRRIEKELERLEMFNPVLANDYRESHRKFFTEVKALYRESEKYQAAEKKLDEKFDSLVFMTPEKKDSLDKNYIEYMDDIKKIASSALCEVLGKGFESISPTEIENLEKVRGDVKLRGESSYRLNENMDDVLKLQTGLKLQHKAEPAWCSSLLSLRLASPPIPGIFDQLIIDESSQVDCICIIPALYRAKRVAMIGDPEQFKPILNIKPNKHRAIWQSHFGEDFQMDNIKWSYLENTAFDVVRGPDTPRIMLKEHFRCDDGIAAYFNEVFYRGQLRVRTHEHPLNFPTCLDSHDSLQWIDVRNSQEGEIRAAVDCFKKIKESGFKGTVGIINPLKNVVEFLRTEIIAAGYSEEDVKVNTAYGFQGQECDVIIFVLGYNDSVKAGKRWYITSSTNRNIYNVTISRAKACLVVVGDREAAKSASMPEISKLARYPKKKITVKKFDSPLEEKLYNALLARNIVTEIQYYCIGYYFDMAYCDSNIKLDIEVDGYQFHFNEDGTRKHHDIKRDIAVKKIGWTVERFLGREIVRNIDACVDRIEARILGAKARAERM